MMKLKRLKIDQFRNVAPGTELRFRDSLNVLLGKNGTGKTTLLNLIVAVLSGNFEPFRDEAFSVEYELAGEQGRLAVHLRNQLVGAEVGTVDAQERAVFEPPIAYSQESVALGLSARYRASCEARLHLANSEKEYLLKVVGADWVLQEVGGERAYRSTLIRPLMDGPFLTDVMFWLIRKSRNEPRPAIAAELASQLEAGVLARVQRFDESLGYLDGLIQSKNLFVVLRMAEGFLILPGRRGASSIIQPLERMFEADALADRLVLKAHEAGMSFLARAVHLLGFASGEVRLQRTARDAGPPERIQFGDLQFYFVRRDGSEIDSSRLSYGQKRLLSFYYYLDCSSACAVADELVNGMHHEWIEACLEDLGERQAFLTSQNPLLLDYLGFESAEEVRSSFVLCRSQFQGEREQLRWENMTAEDAEGFFQAYQVGIQHVSEILRTRGLW